ncbi:hypothetical protein [Gottfriedia solisilvae]|uniref:Lipoprotein n=1 Tax=Gottfriedia solisilvae TaxID=1516104 RepID=A0A8J3ETN9_9BACI|nr:hypothetical protein [Gottfriedia solisilvae]GGI10079.1 hypothetical protein GCM10007380_00990 [Gottfriedia solisilvae]
MKKLFMLLTVMFVFMLSSCSSNEESKKKESILDEYKVMNSHSEVRVKDFIYRIVSEKQEYANNEKVKIYAELEYVGNEEQVTIYHAASPFYFNLKEKTRNYDIVYGMNQPLVKTTIVKGKPLREEYFIGNGSYSGDDPKEYVDFMKKIMDTKRLPYGYYILNGNADFYVETVKSGKNVQIEYNINSPIDFKVNE